VRTSRDVRNWENWLREEVRDLADVVGRRAKGVWYVSVVQVKSLSDSHQVDGYGKSS
jgi:hypothetical protein